ncbi:transcription factor MafB [Bradysia coprophila]|uniref:transcription factor MafB n=1 Tax=Bradysia coprophila TaxID=38358 RepID=UPI00187DB85E|nr:transcription factor MafB [Bradysia coprophila]
MADHFKNMYSIPLVILIFVTIFAAAKPVPDRSKIRIHVPVKHHTHYHTKTIIKHVPVKHEYEEVHHKPYKYPHHHHHPHRSVAAVDDDDDDEIIWPQKSHTKKKKFHHPFIKK